MASAIEKGKVATADLDANDQPSSDERAAVTQVDRNPSATRSDRNMRAADTLFDFDSTDLRPAGRATLDDFADDSKASSSAQISVVGYTDRIGSEGYNQQLSERRVEAVKGYLVSQGIQAFQLNGARRVLTTPYCRRTGVLS